MSFTSFDFIIFLAMSIITYYALPVRFQKYVLLISSIVFYCSFGIKSILIILISVFVIYLSAIGIERTTYEKTRYYIVYRRGILIAAIIIELFLLIAIKYVVNFREKWNLLVPIGISFYTLSIIGYLIDVYRNDCKAEKHFPLFLLYVIWFPHILQGPIARYGKLMPQFRKPEKLKYMIIKMGTQLMLWGYVKKLVIADRAAIFVDSVYSKIKIQSGTILLLASIFYTLQIYMDFSGCVDIALGASEIFGIQLSSNFRQPYFANSINDFWRRWHISLSSWFRDYLYIPLGGNRKGKIRRWLNVLIVFTVSGFWHGVGINFVIWGMLHGVYQILGICLQPARQKIIRLLKFDVHNRIFLFGQVVITLFLVNLAWIFFRVTDLQEALEVARMSLTNITPWVFTDGTIFQYGISSAHMLVLILFVFIAVKVDILHEKQIKIRECIQKQHIIIRWTIYLGAIFSILLFGVYGIGYDAKSFIYMNF